MPRPPCPLAQLRPRQRACCCLQPACQALSAEQCGLQVAYKPLHRNTPLVTSISQSAVDLWVTGGHFQTLTIPSRDDVTMSVWVVRQRARSVMMSWCPTGGRSGRQRSSVGVVRGLPYVSWITSVPSIRRDLDTALQQTLGIRAISHWCEYSRWVLAEKVISLVLPLSIHTEASACIAFASTLGHSR